MATITVSRLRLGQRFSWIPADWYGPCRLIYKSEPRRELELEMTASGWKRKTSYDLKYDCACINPPGVSYGVPGSTRVRLLKTGQESQDNA